MRDIIIIGAGPAGLLVATRLAQAGIRCTLYDTKHGGGGGCTGTSNDITAFDGCCDRVPLGAMRVTPTLTRTLALFRELHVATAPFGFDEDQWVRRDGRSVPVSDGHAVNDLFGVRPLDLDLGAQPTVAANALFAASTGIPEAFATVAALVALPEPERIRILSMGRWRDRSFGDATWGEVLTAFVGDEVRVALQAVSGFEFLSQSNMSAFTYLLMLTSWAQGGGGGLSDGTVLPICGFSGVFRKIRQKAIDAGVCIRRGRVIAVTKNIQRQWQVEFARKGTGTRRRLRCADVVLFAISPAQIEAILGFRRVPKCAQLITVPVTKAMVITTSERAKERQCRRYVIRDAEGRQLFRWCRSADRDGRSAWMPYYTGAFGASVRGLGSESWEDQLRAFGIDDASVSASNEIVSDESILQFWDRSRQSPGKSMRDWALGGLGPNLFGAHSFMSTSWQGWLEGSLQLVELVVPEIITALTN